jgi:hypothetical protein
MLISKFMHALKSIFSSFSEMINVHLKFRNLDLKEGTTLVEIPHCKTDITDAGLLGCNAMWTSMQIPTFWRNTLPPSSGLPAHGVTAHRSTSPSSPM